MGIDEDKINGGHTTPLKAIKAKCTDCCCGSRHEVKLCEITKCPLHKFRFGKNPYLKKRNYTKEQIEEMRKRLASNRKSRNEE